MQFEVDGATGSVPDLVRAACAGVAGLARSVAIEVPAIEPYAVVLADSPEPPPPDLPLSNADRESRAAFVLCLDAINFGSGWWPTIRKRPGRSGYATIEAGLAERFRAEGAWPARELTRLSADDVAQVTGQDPAHPLMEQYASTLCDVGERVLAEHAGSFGAVIEAAGGSALALTDLLAGWDAFADVSTYDGRPVPFYKRAQIAAADIDRFGVARLRDTKRLTAFADNLVPHVLRVDGVLRLDPALEQAIDAESLLVHGSPQEVELRACAVHAIELLSAATNGQFSPAQIDAALWNRGAAPRYKSRPRPRSLNTAY
ncbi:MAG TPA: queuosine salvage family protein [Solirubrobacterales bacterium]|nr:queuosine salvage family protein [Solirubrobacterales bacterium]